MHEFDRVLVQGGEVVLCEPNAAHEHDAGSIAVMEKHGILERGMDLADVAQYIEGTSFLPPKQELILRVSDPPAASPPPAEYLSHHNWSANNLFTIRKPSSPPADETALELEG